MLLKPSALHADGLLPAGIGAVQRVLPGLEIVGIVGAGMRLEFGLLRFQEPGDLEFARLLLLLKRLERCLRLPQGRRVDVRAQRRGRTRTPP